MILRPYQENLVAQARSLISNQARSVLIVAPCGAGKTALTAHMIGRAAARGKRAWFINHRIELVDQSSAAFSAVGIKHGIIAAGEPETDALVQVCSIDTLRRRMDRLAPPDLVVWDECHRQAARSWDNLYNACSTSIHIGLTATPIRLDGTGLGKWFQHMIEGPTVRELTAQGYLSPASTFAPTVVDLAGVSSRGGEYSLEELDRAVSDPKIIGSAITEYNRRMPGGRALVFCVSIRHSEETAAAFRAAGIRAAHLDGTTDKATRRDTMNALRRGDINVITNCSLFSEGVDAPALDGIIMLRPTQSVGLYTQMVGRALRVAPGKTRAVILDHVGNYIRHGLYDEPRTWSLESKKKRRKKQPEMPVKTCPLCFWVGAAGARTCGDCGHIFAPSPNQARAINEELGSLSEIKGFRRPERTPAERRTRAISLAKCRSLDDFVKLANEWGYKQGWAHIMWKMRK